MKEVNGSIWHTMSTKRVTPTDFVCGSDSLGAHGVPNASVYFFHKFSPLPL